MILWTVLAVVVAVLFGASGFVIGVRTERHAAEQVRLARKADDREEREFLTGITPNLVVEVKNAGFWKEFRLYNRGAVPIQIERITSTAQSREMRAIGPDGFRSPGQPMDDLRPQEFGRIRPFEAFEKKPTLKLKGTRARVMVQFRHGPDFGESKCQEFELIVDQESEVVVEATQPREC